MIKIFESYNIKERIYFMQIILDPEPNQQLWNYIQLRPIREFLLKI